MWVMVLFMVNKNLRWGEQVRHLKARASLLQKDDGNYDAVSRHLDLARALCDDSDHELLCTQAVAELDPGPPEIGIGQPEAAQYALKPNSRDNWRS